MGVTLVVLVGFVTLSASLSVGVSLVIGVFHKVYGLIGIHVLVSLLLHGESRFDLANRGIVEVLREGNLENNEQVTEFVRLFVEGKTLIRHSLDVIRLDNFTGLALNSQLSSIQVSDHEINTSEGLKQSNLLLNKQISSLSLEFLVRLLLHDNYDITGFHSGILVSFSVERVLTVVGRTLIDRSFEDLLFLDDLFTIASLTLVLLINYFSLAATIVTRSLRLGVHARSEHLHASDHSTSLASSALLDSAFFASSAFALNADTFTVDSNLGGFSLVNLLKSHLKRVHNRLALLGATWLLASATSKHLTEDVVHATGTAALLEALDSVLVVGVSLILVSEDFPGFLDLLELFFVATSIGVMLQS